MPGTAFTDLKISSSRVAPSWLPKLLSVIRITVGFLFLEHGLATAFGVFEGRPDHNFAKLHAWAGPIETTGAILLILGLFTRTTGFILAGEMAVAYFSSRLRWQTPGIVLLPLPNGGEEAVLNSFFFLWLTTAGGGPWSLDALIAKWRQKKPVLAVSDIQDRVRT
jgi:putative oxidoreductase